MSKEEEKVGAAVVEKVERITLTRDMILAQRDELQVEEVILTPRKMGGKLVPVSVWVREMTGTEKDLFERSMRKRISTPGGAGSGIGGSDFELNLDNYKAKLACVTVCDESGNLLFDLRDIQKISGQLSASNLEKIVNTAQAVNAISEKDKEELLGNLEQDLIDNSTSDSAEN